MSTDDQQPGDDLVDRWLAHRARTAEDPASRPRTYGIARTQPAGRPKVDEAEAVEAVEVVEVVETPAAEAPESTPVAAAAASEVGIDLEGFEPVLTASARRALEQPEQGRGRGRRGRRRDAEPAADPVADPEVEPVAEPEVAETGPEAVEEAEDPAPPDHVGVGRDVLALLGDATPAPAPVPAAEPTAAPEPEPDPDPDPEPVPMPEPGADPPGPASPARTPRLGAMASSLRAGVQRAVSGDPEQQAARPATRPSASPALPPAPAEHPAPPAVLPTELHSPGGVRAVTGVLLLLALAATGIAGYVAYQDPTETALGVAGALALLSAVIWAVRAGSSPTRMSLQQGRLEIHSAAGRHVFDLANPHTSIEIRGRPGSRGWKVLFHRRAMAPFVVDSSMVDPGAFTEVLLHHRPDLGAAGEAAAQRR
ncbi:hypothetical protein JOE61_002539 [Nocardioides salarius]|uniref:PH domain-containing protein n=1 Tax=Nocardioides salarius TaxID=374513 RepID=A0ABS2MC53_9ACTN|nr:hypothetical protein [Nocardioides salarius]MBM7508725.1 hypothetical protein [Nocardioides salarius]